MKQRILLLPRPTVHASLRKTNLADSDGDHCFFHTPPPAPPYSSLRSPPSAYPSGVAVVCSSMEGYHWDWATDRVVVRWSSLSIYAGVARPPSESSSFTVFINPSSSSLLLVLCLTQRAGPRSREAPRHPALPDFVQFALQPPPASKPPARACIVCARRACVHTCMWVGGGSVGTSPCLGCAGFGVGLMGEGLRD
jgi:hypothetical protein